MNAGSLGPGYGSYPILLLLLLVVVVVVLVLLLRLWLLRRHSQETYISTINKQGQCCTEP
jgi:uncharacterized membrane protein